MTRSIELLDRADFKDAMRDLLTIDPVKTVILTIDMQRDYLDPTIATSPVRADLARRIVADTAQVLEQCRAVGIPVVHCYVSRRPEEAALGAHSSAYMWDSRHAGLSQNIVAPARTAVDRVHGSGNEEVVADLVRAGDFMMSSKREMDSFHLTDLGMILDRYLKPEVVLIVGINTDTCVYATTFGASARGYRPVLIRECVGSVRGEDQHEMALELMSRSVAWVLTAEELTTKLGRTSRPSKFS